MKQITCIALAFLLAGATSDLPATKITEQGKMMTAKGNFEVNLLPKEDVEAPAGRMIINKRYQGDMEGFGVGQMVSKRTKNGTAIYYAIEEFSGSVNSKSGAFTLIHKGYMDKESQFLEVVILDGSGSDELKYISGSMSIVQDGDNHTYELSYKL